MPNEQKILSLPAPVTSAAQESRLERLGMYQSQSETPETEAALPLSHYLWIINRGKWKLLAFVVIVVASTIIVSSRLTPYFQSTATIDIDRLMPTGVIGQEASTRPGINDSEQFLSTQVKLIQSDSVLRPVAQRLKLQFSQAPGASLPSARAQDAPVSLKNLSITRPVKTYLVQISYR